MKRLILSSVLLMTIVATGCNSCDWFRGSLWRPFYREPEVAPVQCYPQPCYPQCAPSAGPCTSCGETGADFGTIPQAIPPGG